ncbi:hypothetical protein [Anaerolentibacter hominis]|uniref:hypothetical protein n=1 Tax=Anaerolentibacter hominis TaxID=3079009 RepID=UPI0031B828C6
MKKNKIRNLAVLALALTLVTTSLMSGTLAKYATTVTGTGTGSAAKWAVAVSANGATQTSNFTFNLEDTGTNKDNVASGKIAPGSTGSIVVGVDATGTEVDTVLKAKLDTTGLKGLPIKFYDSDAASATEITGEITLGNVAAGAEANVAEVNKTIYWKWIEGDTDTAIGSKATEAERTGTFTLALTAEQAITAPVAP